MNGWKRQSCFFLFPCVLAVTFWSHHLQLQNQHVYPRGCWEGMSMTVCVPSTHLIPTQCRKHYNVPKGSCAQKYGQISTVPKVEAAEIQYPIDWITPSLLRFTMSHIIFQNSLTCSHKNMYQLSSRAREKKDNYLFCTFFTRSIWRRKKSFSPPPSS